ncbi:MAG TPA: HAMP domain-containing sensor histidine kinase [Candidatus Dormibacteraeota bacterium]|nr:HAMP domain-containing sensor histidine kinase [Candidatus Dormibacteraeota bacterium]
MSIRTKLLAVFMVTIVAAVSLVAWGMSVYTRRTFEQLESQRTDALVAQFRREYEQRGEEVLRRVQGIADAEATLRMAMDLNRPEADASQYYNDARGIAQAQQLDFLDIVGDDGTLISSSEWPARFGTKNDWVGAEQNWNAKGAFLRRVELPNSVELGLLAVRTVQVGDKRIFLIGGLRLDRSFLARLVLPENTRALLYSNLEQGFVPSALADVNGPAAQAELFSPLITEVQKMRHALQRTIALGTARAPNSEDFYAIPLLGRDGNLLGVFLAGSSRREMAQMLVFLRSLALLAGGGVILLGLILGWWISARVTRPVKRLTAGAREVAAGRWDARVQVGSRDEIGRLGKAFNEMTGQITEQRERLVRTERVAAWRELSRSLAHELKNPLFPLQLTVEGLQRAREQTSERFDEIFFESMAGLRAELENLKAIVTRFSDFGKMLPPDFRSVDVNECVRGIVKRLEPQLSAVGRPPISTELYLDENIAHPQADPGQLRQAIENLVLNSMDAMPAGGTLTVRTSQHDGLVRLEVGDTGAGLTPEECARLFTSGSASRQHGTALSLAIVQSVVGEHGGKVSVESAPGAGTTFRIELPIEHRAAQDAEEYGEQKAELKPEQNAEQSAEPTAESSPEPNAEPTPEQSAAQDATNNEPPPPPDPPEPDQKPPEPPILTAA